MNIETIIGVIIIIAAILFLFVGGNYAANKDMQNMRKSFNKEWKWFQKRNNINEKTSLNKWKAVFDAFNEYWTKRYFG